MANTERKNKGLINGYLVTLVVFVFLVSGGFSFYQEGSLFATKLKALASTPAPKSPPQTPPCVPSPSSWSETEKLRDEYRCDSDVCGANILHRKYQRTRTCFDDGCGGSGCGAWSDPYYTAPTFYKDLESWLRCDDGGTQWRSSLPSYNCRGRCLDVPTNGSPSGRNIDLPANMSWDNVRGFGNKARKGPASYVLTINNTNTESGGETFDFAHDFTGEGEFPLWSTLPNIDLLEASDDREFFLNPVNQQYRFIRPTSHGIRNITSCFGMRWAHWRNPPFNQFHNGIDIGHSNTCLGNDSEGGVCSIYASAPGTITRMANSDTAGLMVVIDHSGYKFDGFDAGSNVITRSLHLRSFSGGQFRDLNENLRTTSIKEGDRITPARTIEGERVVGQETIGEDQYGNPIIRDVVRTVQIRNDTVIGTMGTTGRSTGVHLHFDIRINGQFVDPLRLITVPADRPWEGMNCKKTSETTAGLHNILAMYARGEVESYDPEKERFFPHLPPFSFKEEGNPFTAVLRGNKFSAENCLLRPNDTYPWSVKACCGWEGTECGQPASWSMSTSNKVEKLTQGTEAGTPANPEIIYRLEDANLRWCEIRNEVPVRGGGTHFPPPDRYEVQVQQFSPFLFWGTWRNHPLLKETNGIIPIIASPPARTPATYITNERSLLFTTSKNDYANYKWRVRACRGEDREQKCGEFTPFRYMVVSDEVTVAPPILLEPSNDPDGNSTIGWPVSLRWSASLGANSYRLELFEGTKRIMSKLIESGPGEDGLPTRLHEVTLPSDDIKLKLNTLYRWQVQSCWDTKGNLCEDKWSERYFKTTGRPPLLKSPVANANNILIPLQLEWERVPGAGSYRLNFNGVETIVVGNRANIGHPILKQNTTYTWSVRTCNDPKGEVCEESSETRSFRTLTLESPQNLKPPRTDYFSGQHNSADLSWDKVLGARYYRLSVFCNDRVVFDRATNQTEINIPLACVGENNWTVKACIDGNCNDHGPLSQGSFVFHEGEMVGVGLVPCGLNYDNPNTPWNERGPCRFSHLFVMLKIILDFLFWQLMPIVLVIMIVVSGLIFYLSLGNPNVIVKIKAIWSSVGKGLLIMFFGWTAITIIMAIMGYTGIFGPWWQISF